MYYIYQRISDYIGYFNVITFDPTDLELVKGAPLERRRFLNVNISQMDNTYLISLIKYNKIVKNRNDYLKTIDKHTINHDYLDSMTDIMSEEAIKIIDKRKKFIETLNEYVKKASLFISNNKETVSIEYLPNSDSVNIKKEYKDKKMYDVAAKTTTVGPHRDEMMIKINGEEANIYGSQGQIRTVAISIKLGLAEYLKTLNNKQIVLLDDVFSELDESRQAKLLEVLVKNSQIFITTTNIDSINQEMKKQSNIIKVEKGENV